MTNKYLKLGYYFSRFLMGVTILTLVFVALLIGGISVGWVAPSEWLSVSSEGNATIWFFGKSSSSETLPIWATYLILFRMIFILGVWAFLFSIIQKVLHSVRDLKTFQKQNIQHFQKIGFGFLLLAGFDLLGINPGQDAFTVSLSISLTYFALSGASFLLSEVFREGHELYEQNRLMI